KTARAAAQRAARPSRLVALLALLVLAFATVGGCEPLTRPVTNTPTPSVPTESDTTTGSDTTPETLGERAFKIDSAYTGGSGPRVAVIGDSLTLEGRPYLFAELSAYRVKIASIVGEGIGGGAWANAWKVDFLAEATQGYLTDA